MDNSKLFIGMGIGLLMGGILGCMAHKCRMMKCLCNKMREMKEACPCECNTNSPESAPQ